MYTIKYKSNHKLARPRAIKRVFKKADDINDAWFEVGVDDSIGFW